MNHFVIYELPCYSTLSHPHSGFAPKSKDQQILERDSTLNLHPKLPICNIDNLDNSKKEIPLS